jgi:hypothetical protein
VIETPAPAKPARTPSGIASDAAALGYAPPLHEYRNAGDRSAGSDPDGDSTRPIRRADYSVRSWCSRSVKR